MHGLVEGARGQGRTNRTWLTDIARWTGIGATAQVREAEDSWKCGMIVTSSECTKSERKDMGMALT